MELEQVNSTIETDVIDTEDKLRSGEGQIFNIDIDGQLDDLASLLVEKILADKRISGLVNIPRRVQQPVENSSFKRGRSESYPRSITRIRDLVKLDNKRLALGKNVKFAQDYLNAIELIYLELNSEFGREFYQQNGYIYESFLQEAIAQLPDQNLVELLYRIETFVVVLYYDATPACMVNKNDSYAIERESEEKTKKRITALGYELLYFFYHLETLKKISEGINLSSTIQLFLKFMQDYRFNSHPLTGMGEDLLNTSVYFESLNELNSVVHRLKRMLSTGNFQLQPSFYSYQRRSYQRLKGINDSHSITGTNATQFKVAIQNYSKRLKDAIAYFSDYKDRSITLYRFRVILDDKTQTITLDERKKFFSELNKKAVKPTVGLSGYLNFFYFWNKQKDQWFQDIVLIMDSNTLFNENSVNNNYPLRDIREEFQKFNSEILAHRGGKIFENKELPEVKIQSVSLMDHLDLPSEMLLDIKNHENWKLFERTILPFFLYHELLLISDSEVKDRFSRGFRNTR